MPSPFPGVDPYLESQHFWEDFHPSFLTYCRDRLNDILPEGFVAQLGERLRLIEVSQRTARVVRPDLAMIGKAAARSRPNPPQRRSGQPRSLEPVTIAWPSIEMEVSEVWIEIRRRTVRIPVTVMKLLSPTNKTGDGFIEYKLKRRALVRQKIHLVELDLLLSGRRLPMSGPLPDGDYFAFISRAQQRPNSDVYAWGVRDRLPSIPIPLSASVPDVELDLFDVFATAYDRGRYAKLIDYTAPPLVIRDPDDRAWAEKVARRGARSG